MYAQIVYKDKNLLELNNKILELERRLIDLQEFIGEKNEVIRGRDKVIQVFCFMFHIVNIVTKSESSDVTKIAVYRSINDLL